ncbi:hypothetical protein AB0J80_22860 [Actinoplanes sp. NPDC049548]
MSASPSAVLSWPALGHLGALTPVDVVYGEATFGATLPALAP